MLLSCGFGEGNAGKNSRDKECCWRFEMHS